MLRDRVRWFAKSGNTVSLSASDLAQRIQFACDVVAQASAFAGVPPPVVRVAPMTHCFALYNPFRHRVTVAHDMLAGLGYQDLRTLLAHEIGHARDRQQLTRDGLRYTVPLCALVTLIGLLFAWIGYFGTTFQALLVCVAGSAAVHFWDRLSHPRWTALVSTREEQADVFATAFLGDPYALARMTSAGKRLRGQES